MNVVKCIALPLLLLAACSQSDPRQELEQLKTGGQVSQIKEKYREILAAGPDRALSREFIQFLYDQKHYRDFIKEANGYLSRNPDDADIRNLRFEYYAMLAADAERQGNYAMAMEYIVAHLLSPDYADYRTWETRQVDVFKDWFAKTESEGDVYRQKEVLSRMKNLGFENLAKTLAPDLYAELEAQSVEGQQQ